MGVAPKIPILCNEGYIIDTRGGDNDLIRRVSMERAG